MRSSGHRQPRDFSNGAADLCRVGGAECEEVEWNLRTTKSSLAEIQAIAHLGSWDFDIRTRRAIWSDETYHIFGVDPATFAPSYETLLERIHPDDRAAFDKNYAESVENHAVHDIDLRIVMDDGSIKYIHTRGRTYYDNTDRPLHFVGIVHDISGRKKAEANLKKSEMQLANALALTRAAPWEFDVASNLFTFNDMFYAIIGITEEEVGGYQMTPAEYVERFVYPDDIPCVAAELQIALKTSDPNYSRELQHRFIYANGETGVIAVEIRVLQDENGRTIKTYGVNQDITKRKQMEEELSLSKALSVTAVECSLEGILIVDASLKVISYNRVFMEMWKLPKQNIEGPGIAPWLKYLSAQMKDPDAYLKRVHYLYASPAESAHDRLELKDGRIIDRDSVSLYNENGKYLGRAWFFRDITERVRAEQALRESEEDFRAIFSTVREGIFVTEPETGKFVEVNDSGCSMFGYSREEFIGGDIGMISSEEPQDVLKERIHDLTDGAVEFDWHCRRRDGNPFWAAVSLQRGMFRGRQLVFATLWNITERKQAEATILQMACYDPLTGLLNRRVFVDALARAVSQISRSDGYLAVLYIDLDHFKDINDILGHRVGDLLLKAVSIRLQANVRAGDIVARFGGDEFAVIVSELADLEDAAVLSQKLLKELAEPYFIQDNEIRSGTSIGIATYGADSPDAESLITHADVALYRAKMEGRGSFQFFTDSMDKEIKARVSLVAELRSAIAKDELELFYQPEVELETGDIRGLEALVRWNHPQSGLVGPNEFIVAAERGGLIIELGRWVMREACHQARVWMDMQIAPAFVAINLSALQFRTPEELEKDIARSLAESRLPAQKLEVELTETVLMDASPRHGETLHRLRDRGVRVAIDDFGTGYSSLDYLRRFPVDRIKIAQTFVSELETAQGNRAIVRAALGLARELGLGVIAEGIETREQLILLKSWGCREGQGYYFARPLPVREVTELLRKRCGLYAASDMGNERAQGADSGLVPPRTRSSG